MGGRLSSIYLLARDATHMKFLIFRGSTHCCTCARLPKSCGGGLLLLILNPTGRTMSDTHDRPASGAKRIAAPSSCMPPWIHDASPADDHRRIPLDLSRLSSGRQEPFCIVHYIPQANKTMSVSYIPEPYERVSLYCGISSRSRIGNRIQGHATVTPPCNRVVVPSLAT